MARVTKTPGATTEPTADQTDLPLGGDADSNTNGEADVSQATESNTSDQSTSETSSLTEPVNNDLLNIVLENQKRLETKIDQLLKAGGVDAPKKLRWVQGKNGLEQKEI